MLYSGAGYPTVDWGEPACQYSKLRGFVRREHHGERGRGGEDARLVAEEPHPLAIVGVLDRGVCEDGVRGVVRVVACLGGIIIPLFGAGWFCWELGRRCARASGPGGSLTSVAGEDVFAPEASEALEALA